MQKFIGVEYDKKPNDIEIYKTGADITISAVETEKIDQQTGETKTIWICDIDRYTLLEYVFYQQNKYSTLQSELTQAQFGLAEVYELVIGGGA
ncbi:MAG: hypothetical protein PHC48_02675 [Prevotella sp.]|nr:hypothetical protein [Prevotella sp.]